jgi:hypothetical protein
MYSLYWNGEITFSKGIGNKNRDEMKKKANIVRKFGLSNQTYRDIVSAALKMAWRPKNKLIFLTATFPNIPSEVIAQKIFTQFLQNLRLNEKFNTYIWAKELQGRGSIHYHLLCDMGFISIKKLQETWNKVCKNIDNTLPVSNNSLRLPNSTRFGNIVANPVQMARYLGKYFSKAVGQEWNTRAYAISNELYPLKLKIDETEAIYLCRKYQYKSYSDSHLYSKTYLIDVNMMKILRDFPSFIDKIT